MPSAVSTEDVWVIEKLEWRRYFFKRDSGSRLVVSGRRGMRGVVHEIGGKDKEALHAKQAQLFPRSITCGLTVEDVVRPSPVPIDKISLPADHPLLDMSFHWFEWSDMLA